MLLWKLKTASNSRNHSSNASKLECVLAYYSAVRHNVSIPSTLICVVPINVYLKHGKRVISTSTSEVIEALAQFKALDVIV